MAHSGRDRPILVTRLPTSGVDESYPGERPGQVRAGRRTRSTKSALQRASAPQPQSPTSNDWLNLNVPGSEPSPSYGADPVGDPRFRDRWSAVAFRALCWLPQRRRACVSS